jgi:hypothetical protein
MTPHKSRADQLDDGEKPFSKTPALATSNLRTIGGELDRMTRWTYFICVTVILASVLAVTFIYAPPIVRDKLIVTLLLMAVTPVRGMFPHLKQSTAEKKILLFLLYEAAIVGFGVSLRGVRGGTLSDYRGGDASILSF